MTRIVHPEQAAFLARFDSKPQILHAPIIAEAPFVTKAGFEVLEPVYWAPRSAYRLVETACSRCGGRGGSEAWKRTGYDCYKCHGDGGKKLVKDTVYTRAEFAKREAKAAAKAAAKRAAEDAAKAAAKAAFEQAHGDLIAKVAQIKRTSDFLASIIEKGWTYGSISEAQAKAAHAAADRELAREQANAGSQWVGTVGERITIEGTIAFTTSYQTAFGTTYITGIKDAAGNLYIQKGVFVGGKGEHIALKATVKEHGTRDGVKQTIISRPKVLDVA